MDAVTVNSNYRPFQEFTLKSKDQQDSYTFSTQEEINLMFMFLINVCHDCFSKSKTSD